MTITSDQRPSMTTKHAPRVHWKVVPHSPALVLVGYCGAEPAAIIERDSSQTYRLVSCRGADLGSYPSIADAQASFERELRS